MLHGNLGLLFRHALNDAWQCSTEIHEAEILASSFLSRHHHFIGFPPPIHQEIAMLPKAVHLIYMAIATK